ncbi:hypothetical protein [Phycicoccus flavus]|uniref:hypothetical protein n=1 Tax=Phycicoccus flavus TaxID=2502783 RepID=UPI000FEBEE31|nr:hypothetical protein [Phycicoccus flavus]NHA70133.1 hypothetical protein [Phycicoccus flavus]
MTRSTLRTDRAVGLLLGLLLLAVGTLVVLWWARVLTGPERLTLAGADGLADTAWWPWAAGLGGLVLGALGLSWAAAHLRRVSVRSVSLDGSGEEGRLRLRLDALASAAADSAADRIAVESASGSVGSGPDAGLVEVRARVRHDATLEEVRRDLAAVDDEVALATDGQVPVRYRVHVARPPRDSATS